MWVQLPTAASVWFWFSSVCGFTFFPLELPTLQGVETTCVPASALSRGAVCCCCCCAPTTAHTEKEISPVTGLCLRGTAECGGRVCLPASGTPPHQAQVCSVRCLYFYRPPPKRKKKASKLWDSTAISVEVCQKCRLKIANKSHTCVNKHSSEQSAVLRSE